MDKARAHSPGLLYPALLLVSETAAKTNDITGLKWRDIDLKNKRVRFPGNMKIQAREIEVTDATVAAFKRLESISDFVFTTLEGRPVQKHLLTRELRGFQRTAGLETNWVFRDLRHSFAVNFLMAGGEMEVLQKILGHWHTRLTEELYGSFKAHKADLNDLEGVPATEGFSSETDEFGEF